MVKELLAFTATSFATAPVVALTTKAGESDNKVTLSVANGIAALDQLTVSSQSESFEPTNKLILESQAPTSLASLPKSIGVSSLILVGAV